jgi:hypothetical protein
VEKQLIWLEWIFKLVPQLLWGLLPGTSTKQPDSNATGLGIGIDATEATSAPLFR